MRAPTRILAPVVALAAALALWADPARAVQLAISQPPDFDMLEDSGRAVQIGFRVINTGVPVTSTIELLSIKQVVTPGSDDPGDITREVLKPLIAGDCKRGDEVITLLSSAESCDIVSIFLALDGDPFDEDKKVDSALWLAGISINWRFRGQTEIHNDVNGALVTIKDDPVPEPAAWALMLGGLAGLGAVLRGRRRAQAATVMGAWALAAERSRVTPA